MNATRDRLEEELQEAPWAWIVPHHRKGTVFIVNRSLDIVDVGVALAENDTKSVEAWIEKNMITRPTADQAEAWELNSECMFQFLIVQPYVLIQDTKSH